MTEPAAEPKSLFKRFEDATKAAAAIVAVVYLFGFLVNALYFGRYGISAIGLVRLQYILAGVWLLLPFAIWAWIVALVVYAFGMEYGLAAHRSKQEHNAKWHLYRIGNGLAGLFGAIIVVYLVLHDLWALVRIDGAALRGARGFLMLYVIGISALIAMLVVLAMTRHETRPPTEKLTMVGFSALIVVALLGYTAFFAARVYPHLPSALGGGAPTRVQFALKEKSTLAPNRFYDLLLVTDENVVILQDKHAIEVSRDSIEAIHYP